VIVEADAVETLTRRLTDAGETVYRIGTIESAPGKSQDTVISGTDTAWRD